MRLSKKYITAVLFTFTTVWLFFLVYDKEYLRKRNVFRTPGTTKNKRIRLNKTFLITWYAVPHFIAHRAEARAQNFDSCEYSNCVLTDQRETLEVADAVIFKARRLPPPEKLNFKRPLGQVWIFAEDETPHTYSVEGGHWRRPGYLNVFNWTMTYDRTHADIYLPYGELKKRENPPQRDFDAIAKSKSKGALIVVSRCKAQSLRSEYVKKLSEYIDVEVLGKCGKPWKCGKRFIHDDCFAIMNNSYRFYLAFENAFCKWYRTEKLFDNFKFDTVFVTRGDEQSFRNLDKDITEAYISANDFQDAEHLGKFLQSVSTSTARYADLLRKKNKYFVVTFEEKFKQALCEICKRMNFQEDYLKTIPDLKKMPGLDACYKPVDI